MEEKNFNERCFAEIDGRKNQRCRVLTYKNCIGHQFCAHYKTEEQCKQENIKRIEYLRSLPVARQKYIEEKYKIDIWGNV
ncbi:MAG: hypothetical protein J6T96_05485 [Bacteroidales bacterium]|nr:hypothetical protein [Bacteroidales bacterium]